MLRRSRLGLAIALTLSASFLPVPMALADNPPVTCITPEAFLGTCTVGAATPGTSAENVSNDKPSRSGPKVECKFEGATLPCSSEYGSWSNSHGCYLKVASPQPAKTDAVWGGRTTGAIYSCARADGAAGGVLAPVWLAAAPAAVVDPEVLARQALAQMDLKAITIGITPEPGKLGVVGLPTYLWVAQPTQQTFGPITRTAAAGGVTVTATAKVERIEWSMGDGAIVTCTTPGTPYRDEFMAQPSPDCGHTYERASIDQPGKAYPLSATSYWQVEWAGGGQTGNIPVDLTAQAQVRVGEVQVLVTS